MSLDVDFLRKRLTKPEYTISPWDDKRYRVRPPFPYEAEQLPYKWTEYTDHLEPEYDQGEMGTCVGWDGKVTLQSMLKIMGKPAEVSAWSIYQWSRMKANIPSFIEGSTNLGACKALCDWGACTEECWPTPTSWDDPRAEALPCGRCEGKGGPIEQKERAIDSYWQVGLTQAELKAAMYGVTHPAPYKMPDGSPGKMAILTAIPIYKSFTEAEDGVVPLPRVDDVLLGGHSTPYVGWDYLEIPVENTGGSKQTTQKLHYLNQGTWGELVGDGGRFWIPYDHPMYDAFVLHIGPPTDPEPSECIYGKAVAGLLNIGLTLAERKGRFQYVNGGGR